MKNWLKFLAITLSLLAVAMCFGPKVRAQSTASTIYINCVNYSCSPDIGVGINAAIAAGPVVQVPSGTYSTNTTVIVGAGETVVCNGTILQPASSSMTIFAISAGGQVVGCNADVTNQASWSGKVFSFTDNYREGSYTQLDNFHINGTGITTGYGVFMSSASGSQAIAFVSVRHGKVEGLEYPYYLTATGAASFVNGNNFSDLTADKSVYGVYMVTSNSTAAITGNNFSNFLFQNGPSSINSIKITGSSATTIVGDVFSPIDLFDTTTPISIDTAGYGITFVGRWDGTISDGGTLDNFLQSTGWTINGTPVF